MLDKFEVVLPGPEERAHRPPRGFHTFYINQLEMGLRFSLLRFIASLCQHIKISPSQLAPNSYSFLLALAVLLRYHNIPLIPYVLMQLVQVKRLGPEERPLEVRYVLEGQYIYPYSLNSERSPNLAFFLEAMREQSYNAPELVKEDLLCYFGFSRRAVELIGDLDERMSKAAMVSALQEEIEGGSSGVAAPPVKVAKKRKASTPTEKEARRQKKKGASASEARPAPTTKMRRASTPPVQTRKERPEPTSVIVIPEVSSPRRGPTMETGPGRVPALNLFEDSLVVSPSGAMATGFICNMVPDRDISRLRGTTNFEAVGLFAAQLASVYSRSSRALVSRLS
ncbi:hypothetical protein F511_10916 [Dorcoceras hygrometricum]|uniref:Uncharacterized protein n=1 Tax=Dorcoceras hygrometricum TaxID=472368 RepID=A0A2Z7CX03_9LAMI|nr:hypothetical protein F511_10916 [Dorcoceras hygrometricum]